MLHRMFGALALTGTVVIGITACSSDSKDAAIVPAAGSPAPSGASSTSGDYCTGVLELAASTRGLASKSTITTDDYTRTADQYDRLKSIAPADAVPDLEAVSASYRAIANGQTTMDAAGPEVAQASLHLLEVNTAHCPPPK